MSYIKELRKTIGNKRVILVSCGAILENEREEILLQLRADTLNYGIPGGIKELNETLMDTLLREIKEETNISLNKKEVKPFGIYSGDKCLMMYPNKDEVEFVSFIYYAKISNNENIKKDEESKALTFFGRKNLPENIKEMDQIWINKWVKGNFEFEID
ncbi:MAG: NUDIX domain-containing protein [Acholeplasmataceae bacterium]|nr:NUDIX domain-containing protein [Acholeplasmataceae bacterium]